MSYKQEFYPESQYGGFSDVDSTLLFYSRVNALLEESFTILDIGCGRGAYEDDPVEFRRRLRIMKGKVQNVVGLDVNPDASTNPHIDSFALLDGKKWPLEDSSIDLIICDYVMEHVEHPDDLFSEASRVLKPGGKLCIRTPNRWNYIALLATLIPDRLHAKVTSKVQENRKEEDVFPTFYRCNTKGAFNKYLTAHGFNGVIHRQEPDPAYLSFSKIAYFIGVLHQRFAPRIIKPSLFVFATKR